MAVLLEAADASAGGARANPCLAAALAAAPAAPGSDARVRGALDPGQLLPPPGAARQAFVAYRGSLTTPPCSEGVDWLVWTTPQQVRGAHSGWRACCVVNRLHLGRLVPALSQRPAACVCTCVLCRRCRGSSWPSSSAALLPATRARCSPSTGGGSPSAAWQAPEQGLVQQAAAHRTCQQCLLAPWLAQHSFAGQALPVPLLPSAS
jgi:hypothetical protein